jgi:HK97 family phage major capsid protein
MNIEELEARISEAKGRLQELGSLITKESRDLNEEERGEWNTLNEQIESDKESLKERRAVLARVEELAEDPAHRDEERPNFQTRKPDALQGEEIWDLTNYSGDAFNPQASVRKMADGAKRAIERTVPAHEGVNREDVQSHLERLQARLDGKNGAFSRHLLMTGSPNYREGWVKAIGGQVPSPEEQRALNLTGEEGGFLLPYTLDPTIIPISEVAINPIRALAKKVQTTTNLWKGVTSTGMTAAYREAEAEETTDDSPKFVQPEITCHAADAFGQWTYEFGQDYGSIANDLAMLAGEAKDVLEATKLATGSGEKEPFGVYTGAEEIVETAVEKAFGSKDVYATEAKLPDRYTARASWLGHRAIYTLISQFEAEGGQPLWNTLDSLQYGPGATRDGRVPRPLLEYPAYRLSSAQSTVTQSKYILLFGDFNYYVVADRIGMFAKPIPDIPGAEGRPTGQSGLYFWWRTGAKVMTKKAFSKLKVK